MSRVVVRVWWDRFVRLFFVLTGLVMVQNTVAAKSGVTIQAARVLDVNRELRLALVNLGREDGVRMGMPFVVVRRERVVARLRVVDLRDHVCGAAIEKYEKDVNLRSGDCVQVTRN